jgi:hypothetical protein
MGSACDEQGGQDARAGDGRGQGGDGSARANGGRYCGGGGGGEASTAAMPGAIRRRT